METHYEPFTKYRSVGLLAALLTVAHTAGAQDAAPREPVRGRAFAAVMSEKIRSTPQRMPLRLVLDRLRRELRLAIVLDRRIDPDRLITREFHAPVQEILGETATMAGAKVVREGATVYLGPTAAAGAVPELILDRRGSWDELPSKKRIALRRRKTIVWEELDRPRDIVKSACEQFGVTVQNPERIPHDLWNSGAIADGDAAVILTILLTQFGLSFDVDSTGTQITIVPEPTTLKTEFRTTSKTPKAVTAIIAEFFPDARSQQGTRRLTVTARPQDLTEVRGLVEGRWKPTRMNAHRISLTARNVTAREVLDKLLKDGLQIRWEASELGRAGVRLDQLVELNETEATPAEFFPRLGAQIGVQFDVGTWLIRMRPQPPE